MQRFLRASVLLLMAASLSFDPVGAAAKPDKALEETKAQLLGHITVLASDEFEGREPGTDGEAKTLQYLGKQFFDLGLVSGTNDPGHPWYAPVTVQGREPASSRAVFTRKGKRVFVLQEDVSVYTSGKRALVENAPLLFVGNGAQVPPRADLAGRIALLLDGGVEGSARQTALIEAGAAGVLTILDGDRSLESVRAHRRRPGYALSTEELGGDIDAFVSAKAADALLVGSKLSVKALQARAAAADFSPGAIDLAASLEATTRETRIHTHNFIAKLPGKRPAQGAVLLMAHWDHFGQCAQPPAEHLICNGAIDNASGVAVMIETARRLARLPQMDRDVYFVATTAEEFGLLGARAFAENPPVPLTQFVAAFNIDSVAIGPSGQPFTIIGKGLTALDPQIAAVARQQKKVLVGDNRAADFVQRQDGWELLQHDVPAVMVTSSWGDVAKVDAFLDNDYHRPSDVVSPSLELGAAAEDVDFLVALVRWFTDTRRVPARPNARPN